MKKIFLLRTRTPTNCAILVNELIQLYCKYSKDTDYGLAVSLSFNIIDDQLYCIISLKLHLETDFTSLYLNKYLE